MASTQSGNTADLSANALFNVNGLVAVVTGGGTGIGLSITKGLVANGAAKVYILGRRGDVLQKAAESIGPAVIPVVCDVTSKDALREAAATVTRDAGFVNFLVCNSGISGPAARNPKQVPEMTVEEFARENFDVPMEDYTRTFAVNVSAAWYTAMAFLPLLDAGNKKGNVTQTSQVVVTSSIAGFNKLSTAGFAYGQSKAATTHLVKALGVALPHWGIRANAIAPGLYHSEMTATFFETGQVGTNMIPLGRVGDDADLSGAILFLASRAGGYVNGNILVSDGGRLGLFPSTY